jgi:hypothetical protein
MNALLFGNGDYLDLLEPNPAAKENQTEHEEGNMYVTRSHENM